MEENEKHAAASRSQFDPAKVKVIKPVLSPTDTETEEIIDKASQPGEGVESKPKRKYSKRKKSADASKINAATAKALNKMFFSTVTAFGGEDAKAEKEEIAELDAALGALLDTMDKPLLTPGKVLLLAYGKFLIDKVSKPTVYERLTVIGTHLKSRAGSMFARIRNKFKKGDKK